MARRIIFVPNHQFPYFTEKPVEFEWVPGFARTQAQKSISNLHREASIALGLEPLLEASTKSTSDLGIRLSAFNLILESSSRKYPLESLYQSSKVFSGGRQFSDIINMSPVDAKQDPRLRNSGPLKGFRFENHFFNLVPSPNFYDYLYCKALFSSGHSNEVRLYKGFTDHAFSGDGQARIGKSVNCQARSLAIFVGMSYSIPQELILEDLLALASRDLPHEQAELFDSF